MIKKILVLIFVFFSISLVAQKPLDPERYKEYGFNMTGMIANFVPFNSTKLGLQRYAFSYKYTRKRKKSTKRKKEGELRTLRIGIGIDGLFDNNNIFNYNVRIGNEKKHILSKSWSYISANDFIMFVEPSGTFFDEDIPNLGIGYARGYGIEYHINDRISIYTETALMVNVGFPPVQVRIVPPTSVFLNVKL